MPKVNKCGGRIVPHRGKSRSSDGYVHLIGLCERCGAQSISAWAGNSAGFGYFTATCKDAKCGDKVAKW